MNDGECSKRHIGLPSRITGKLCQIWKLENITSQVEIKLHETLYFPSYCVYLNVGAYEQKIKKISVSTDELVEKNTWNFQNRPN